MRPALRAAVPRTSESDARIARPKRSGLKSRASSAAMRGAICSTSASSWAAAAGAASGSPNRHSEHRAIAESNFVIMFLSQSDGIGNDPKQGAHSVGKHGEPHLGVEGHE